MNVAQHPTANRVDSICNVTTEAGLIAAILIDNRQIDRVVDIVQPFDFSDDFYRRIYEIAIAERALGNAVHPGSLRRPLGEDSAKNLAVLISGSGAALIGAVDFAKEIRELARVRRLAEGLEGVVLAARMIETGQADPKFSELANEVELILADSEDKESGIRELTASQCVERVVEDLNDDKGQSIVSGIGSLDSALGALRPRNLIIVAGRPGMGKSALASSYSLGAAQRGTGTLLFSLEMSAEEIGERMACDLCFDSEEQQIKYESVTKGTLTNAEAREIIRAADRIRDLPLSIVDIGGCTVAKLGALVRRYKRRFAARGSALKLVIVDYLQLLQSSKNRDNRTAEVGDISRALKTLAKTEDVAVIALSQLSRKVEERKDKRPQLSDLRESGQIEQDADSIVFLYSAEYYLSLEPQSDARDEALERERSKIDFIIAKRRRGPPTVGHGRYFRQFQAVRS